MRKLLQRRRREDRADAILTMSIIFVGLFALCAGFAIDISKSVYVKSSFQVMAQEATSEAARFVDARGMLTQEAASAVPGYYTAQFDGEAGGMARANEGGRCQTVNVNGTDYKAPYMEITLSEARGAGGVTPPVTYKWDPTNGFRASSGSYLSTGTYRVVTAKVWDTAPHLMLGIVGLDCQSTFSEVSSITFGSQEDVENFYGDE